MTDLATLRHAARVRLASLPEWASLHRVNANGFFIKSLRRRGVAQSGLGHRCSGLCAGMLLMAKGPRCTPGLIASSHGQSGALLRTCCEIHRKPHASALASSFSQQLLLFLLLPSSVVSLLIDSEAKPDEFRLLQALRACGRCPSSLYTVIFCLSSLEVRE